MKKIRLVWAFKIYQHYYIIILHSGKHYRRDEKLDFNS